MNRILIADDSPASRRQVADLLLLSSEHEITFATNGVEALRLLAEKPHDLLLCDIEMPVMNGIQLVSLVRKRSSRYELPILVLTGHTTTADMAVAFRAGANDYLTKPVNADELVARVSVQLDLRRLHHSMLEAQRVSLERKKLESVGQLSAGISHEINTPIQYVCDNLEFLRGAFADLLRCTDRGASGPTLDESELDWLRAEVPRAIEQSLEGAGRVAKLVQAMKEFARPDSHQKSIHDLNQLLKSTLTVCTTALKSAGTVSTAFGAGLEAVPCYAAELNQALLNVIVNAAQAVAAVRSPEQGLIEVRTARTEEWAEITISDNGCGIPEAIRDKIYDPFFTTRDVGKGAGQGLAITRACIVEKHGGEIDFRSAPGSGTTFVVRLPLGARKHAEQSRSTGSTARESREPLG